MNEEETKAEEKVSLSQFLKSHPKSIFWTRLVLFLIFGLILPIAFIIWRFDLFRAISNIRIGGWGIIVVIFVGIFAIGVVKYIKLALGAKYTLFGQCLSGLIKVVLPLMLLYALLKSIQSSLEYALQTVGCVILCEIIAIPVNPLPKWAYDMQEGVEIEKRKSATDYFLSEYFSRKKNEDGKGS